MVKNKFTFLLFCCFILPIFAQANNKYIVTFKDKNHTFDIKKIFLSSFVFINFFFQFYYSVSVNFSADEKSISTISKLSFISSIQKVEKSTSEKSNISSIKENNDCAEIQNVEFEDNYVSSYAQFHLLNGEYLHEQGYNGENMTIAICDAGFRNANTNPGFATVFSEKRMLGAYDYVHNDSTV